MSIQSYRIRKLVKSSNRQFDKIYHHTILKNKPKILVNSIQKAGTHVLTNALHNALPQRFIGRGAYNHCLTRQWDKEYYHLTTSVDTVLGLVHDTYYPGEIIQGHIEFSEDLIRKLPDNVIRFLIIRNPFDVVLSLANWWERHDEIPAVPYLKYKQIQSPKEKLTFLVTGKFNGEKVWPSLVERYDAYIGWLTDSNTLIVKFESLVNNPQHEIYRIESFLSIQIDHNKFHEGMNPKTSKTFTIKDQKVFKELPADLREVFLNNGGAEIIKTFGY